MRLTIIGFSLAALLSLTTAAQEPPAIPIDQCGILQFVPLEMGCWTFNGYEIYGNLCGYHQGDTVRVIGTYSPGFSFCMVAACCLYADTLVPCSGCCEGMTGNVDGSVSDQPDIGDVTAMVAVLFQGGIAFCEEELDVDGSGASGNDVNVSDLTCLVQYLFNNGPSPVPCP